MYSKRIKVPFWENYPVLFFNDIYIKVLLWYYDYVAEGVTLVTDYPEKKREEKIIHIYSFLINLYFQKVTDYPEKKRRKIIIHIYSFLINL